MGFGHRVYKNFDPRAKLMRETCHEVLEELGLQDDPLFKLAMALEKIALEDEYFVSRKLYPNVDFYSGIVQSALGIPVSLFTGIFAMARTIGWIAQWNEMIADPEQKIGRPRQLFIGSPAARRAADGQALSKLLAHHKKASFGSLFFGLSPGLAVGAGCRPALQSGAGWARRYRIKWLKLKINFLLACFVLAVQV